MVLPNSPNDGLTNALVNDTHAADGTARVGMFTTTDLRDALRARCPHALPVRDVARFDPISVTPIPSCSMPRW